MPLASQARISIWLGIASLFAVVLCHLALADIRHGDEDLTLEWGVVRVAFAAILAFQVMGLATLRRVVRERPRDSPRADGSSR